MKEFEVQMSVKGVFRTYALAETEDDAVSKAKERRTV